MWRRGIGNECNLIFDEKGRIVAHVYSPEDGTLICHAVNAMPKEEEPVSPHSVLK
jgi:hypothetical protein